MTAPALTAPFRGLAPFGESELDGMLFFGRERETEIAVANLIASRLTILYGPSGVGKSSLVRAGVARRTRELGSHRAVGRGPDIAVVVFASWADDPVRLLADAIAAEVAPLVSPIASPPPTGSSLASVVEHWSQLLDGELCIVLDQLEEYFVYHEDEHGPGTFLEQLAEIVQRPWLRANVMLSLRDDALARLDVLKARLPALYANTLRLDRLDRDAARAAILGPVQRWNDVSAPGERMYVEPELVDEVLAQSSSAGEVGRVEAPYLQLVMERVWNEEHERGSDALRLATLAELGGAAAIVRDHLDRALGVLDDDQQDAAARMFDHLVTPSGTKIAHRSSDLAEFARLKLRAAQPVLAALGRERILRPLDEAEGSGDRYEIFHDVLAEAIIEWRRRRELSHERIVSRRRQRRLAGGLVAAVVLLIAMGGLTVYAFNQRQAAGDKAALALSAQQQAQANAEKARQQTAAAQKAQHEATVSAKKATELQRETAQALKTTKAAEAQLETALAETKQANETAVAEKNKADAEKNKADAEKTTADAEKNKADAEKAKADANAEIATTQTQRATKQTELARRKSAQLARSNAELVKRRTEVARERDRARRFAAQAAKQASRARAGKVLAEAKGDAFEALSRVDRDPERTLALGLQAYDRKGAEAARPLVERALRLGLVYTKGLRILPSHGAVQTAVFDAGGRRVLTASPDGDARVFDTPTGRLVRTLKIGSPLAAAAFSPDGAVVAAGSRDGRVTLWSVATGTLLGTLAHGGAVTSLAFSPDGRFLATGAEDDTLRLWDAASRLQLWQASPGGTVRSIEFSRDGARILIVANVNVATRPARIYATSTGELLQSFTQRGQITVAAFSPDGNVVATGGRDDLAALWDAHDGRLLHTLAGHRADVLALAFSADGKELATGSGDDTARVWDARTGESQLTLAGHLTAVVSVAFSPDGTHVVTSSTDRTARIWATGDGEMQSVLRGHRDSVTTAAYSPDGMRVLTAGADGVARLWDAATEPVLQVVGKHDGRAFGAAYFPDGKRLASAGADGTLRIWDTASRREVTRFSAGVPLVDAAVSRDGRFVAAAGNDGAARVWRVSDARLTLLPARDPKSLRSVAFSPDGRLVVAAGDDETAAVWRLDAPSAPELVLRNPAGVTVLDAAFSPDGTLVATGGLDGVVRLWRASDGTLVRAIQAHSDGVTGVAFSSDGRRVATSSRDKDGAIWDVKTGARIRTLRGHSSTVSGIVFSADGRWAATAGPIKVGVWATTGDDLLNDRLFFLTGPTGQLTSVAFSPSGFTVAATSFDGTIRTYRCTLCGGVDRLALLARKRLRELEAR